MQNLQAFGFSRVSPLDAHFGLFARAVFKTALETLGPCFPYEKTGRVLDDVQNSGSSTFDVCALGFEGCVMQRLLM